MKEVDISYFTYERGTMISYQKYLHIVYLYVHMQINDKASKVYNSEE